MQDNPYSNEIRYTLGYMMHKLQSAKPGSVRIASRSQAIVESVVRHLCYEPVEVLVETPILQQTVAENLGVKVGVYQPGGCVADAVLLPFGLDEGLRAAGERTLIAACYNALSYKKLIHPRAVDGTFLSGSIYRKLAAIQPDYRLGPAAGLFSPRFIALHTLAMLTARLDSALFFQLEDRAMRHFIDTSSLWRWSYIVIITGRKAE